MWYGGRGAAGSDVACEGDKVDYSTGVCVVGVDITNGIHPDGVFLSSKISTEKSARQSFQSG